MKENEVIRVEDLDFTIETSKILSQVSLSVSKNEFVGLIGPNGSGKSTILKNIYRQYSPSSGAVYLNGKDIYRMKSKEVAQQMASGACSLFGSDYAVSLTGYAGPGGGTDSNPVGTVYIGLCSPQAVFSKRFVFAGDRQEVRFQACLEALRMLFDALGR